MKRFMQLTIGHYKVKVRDYRYTSRLPVGVSVTGDRLGESSNPFGEPCYFYESASAMSINEGIAIAKRIIAKQSHAVAIPR